MLIVLALAMQGAVAAPVPPSFFAAPVSAGSVEVTLHSTEIVAPGVPTLVTFGLPFPRGSITTAQLGSVRATRNGAEIPIHVEEMTPWRHRADPGKDGMAVRVMRIQLEHTFASAFPATDTVTVSWGGIPRTQSRPAADPRSAWHLVNGGSFVAADGVMEPDVYAVLPSSWLVRGALKSSRALPFAAGNPPTRDAPAQMAAVATWPGFEEAERAHKNNFYTLINRDDTRVTPANQIAYRSDAEPWLYDRAANMFLLYFRSGSFVALREAVQNAQFYADRLGNDGLFDFTSEDMKYSYNECLAYAYWTTGDATLLPDIAAANAAFDGLPHAWTPELGFWTERHTAFKLLARTIAYEVFGGAARASAVDSMLTALAAHQDGANGRIPAQRIDGGFYHTGTQHRDWDSALGASPWMSALLSDAMVRAYASDERPATATLIRRLGDFMRRSVVVTTDQQYDDQARPAPYYAVLLNGSDATPDFGPEEEHALDVAGQVAWAYYFSRILQQPSNELRDSTLGLYATYDRGVNFWIRPNGPASGLAAFRVNPPRKWGWEHRVSDGIGFALSSEPSPFDVFLDGFE